MALILKQVLIKPDNPNTEETNLSLAMNWLENVQSQDSSNQLGADVFFAATGKITRIFTKKSVNDFSMTQNQFDIINVPALTSSIKAISDKQSAFDIKPLTDDINVLKQKPDPSTFDTRLKKLEAAASSSSGTNISALNNMVIGLAQEMECFRSYIAYSNALHKAHATATGKLTALTKVVKNSTCTIGINET